ncbi:unnamed protein product [Prunus armeniaca]
MAWVHEQLKDDQLRVSGNYSQVFSGRVGGVAMVPLKIQSFLNTEGVALKNFPRYCNFGGHLLELPRVDLFCGMIYKKILGGIAQDNYLACSCIDLVLAYMLDVGMYAWYLAWCLALAHMLDFGSMLGIGVYA